MTETLRDVLGQWMTENDKNKADVARIADVSESTVGRWLSGRTKNLEAKTVRNLSDGTAIPVRRLLIAAGMFTAEQLDAEIPATDPRDLSNDALLRLVRERMVEPSRPDDLAAHEPAGSRAGDPELTGRHLPRLVQPANGTGNGNSD